METISLIASIVAITLAFFAIWQAYQYKKESDRLNKDTTDKLARIETQAKMTMEAAFGELSKWSEYARQGGILTREQEKETLQKIAEELLEVTRKETDQKINLVEKRVEHRLVDVSKESTVAEIKNDFQNLKQEISKIQQRNVTETADLDKKVRLEVLNQRLNSEQKKVLSTMFNNPKIRANDLVNMGYGFGTVLATLYKLTDSGLVAWIGDEWAFDQSIVKIVKS